MSTLNGLIWSKYSIAPTCPARSHFQLTLSKKRWFQSWYERYRSLREEEDSGEEDVHEKGRRKKRTGDRF